MHINIIQNAMNEIEKFHPNLNFEKFRMIPCENKTRLTVDYIEFDIPPFEGEVLFIDQEVIVVMDDSERKILYFVSKRLATLTPKISSRVKVSPYFRRNFDGTRVDGCRFNSGYDSDFGSPYVWGSSTKLPFEKPKGAVLGKIYDLINSYHHREELYLTHVLVDANACDFVVCDTEIDESSDLPPMIQFKFSTEDDRGTYQIVPVGDDIWLFHWKDRQLIRSDSLTYIEFCEELFSSLIAYDARRITIEVLS